MDIFKDERSSIVSEIDKNGIATITFYHPSHNSFTRQKLEEFSTKINDLGKMKEVKIILLRSKGEGTFCSGASFDELLTLKTRETAKDFFSGFALVINEIRRSEKIVVGQVQGKAIGGGVGLAAACDYCFATESALIRLSELSVNMGPFVIAPAVERKIGLAAFTKLTLNPNLYKSARWAKEHGLYQEVFPSIESMKDAVQSFCISLCGYNPEALTELKKVFWHGTAHWETLLHERADISGKLALNKETKERLKAFKNKA
jgi:methylglutaconyl-CoA hydratase